MKRLAFFIVAIAFVLSAGVATAVKGADFDDVARGAKLVASGEAVRQLAWPFTGSCAGSAPGFDKNQCEVLKRTVRAMAESTAYKVEVPALLRKKGDKLTVYGCLSCEAGASPLTIGPGKVVREGETTLGPVLKSGKGKISDEVAARAETEFIFRLNSKGAPQLSAFRTYDPCSGAVLISEPRSEDRNPSKKCAEKNAAKQKLNE